MLRSESQKQELFEKRSSLALSPSLQKQSLLHQKSGQKPLPTNIVGRKLPKTSGVLITEDASKSAALNLHPHFDLLFPPQNDYILTSFHKTQTSDLENLVT